MPTPDSAALRSAMRRTAREVLMRLVYRISLAGSQTDEETDAFIAEAEEDLLKGSSEGVLAISGERGYFDRTLAAVGEHLDEIDSYIAGASDHWRIERIAKVDLAILRVAAAEICYDDAIPVAVSINEAVELARRYGGDKTYEFVNGVLGRVAKMREGDH